MQQNQSNGRAKRKFLKFVFGKNLKFVANFWAKWDGRAKPLMDRQLLEVSSLFLFLFLTIYLPTYLSIDLSVSPSFSLFI
jgi:hypothetical protein